LLRVVLDVNVLVSAAIGRDGPPRRIVETWEQGAFEVVVSPSLLSELEQVLARPQLVARLDPALVMHLLALLADDAHKHRDPADPDPAVPRDPRDAYLVALARESGAHVIVTGDRHLLELDELQPPAVDPARFAASLERLTR
jgi:putative PIN family toxin of toxin-antitoxin system